MKILHLYGNNNKLLSGLWILAGCFFIGLNGHGFMALMDDPLPEPSREASAARLKFQSFQETLANRFEIKDSAAWDLMNRKFSIVKENISKPVPLNDIPSGEEVLAEKQVRQPVLSGILSFTNGKGEKGYLAILDGITLGEREQVNGITVTGINEKGVMVRRGGSEWFINTPDVGFSVSR
ncbi:MAG: hypothetical protein KKF30_18270 [Proteobacteria bacterium]|nr:hypothetical protein [Pseudomonadota bacterium]MBU4469807.1 hypothetical protein [Pseudomonadota bacterium]MCG2753042.1 hypothetical protein [Desulfobacteraceae bacterium]